MSRQAKGNLIALAGIIILLILCFKYSGLTGYISSICYGRR